tara:strand:- start:642 stop:815 length:174 start_codon:yes stop_codon:yes gene_type:complete
LDSTHFNRRLLEKKSLRLVVELIIEKTCLQAKHSSLENLTWSIEAIRSQFITFQKNG